MRQTCSSAALFAALLLSTLLPTVSASAQSQVGRAIVLRFEGPRASRARDAVVGEIASYVELVDEEQAVIAAQELGVDVSSPDGMAQVVEHLGITLVVTGSIEGRGRNAQTVIVIVDPRGNELARTTAPTPRRRADSEAIGQAAVAAVVQAQAELERQRQAAMAPPEPDPSAYVVEEEPEPEPAPAVVGWRQPYLIAHAGLRLRTIDSAVEDLLGTRFTFAADIYPEIDIDVAIRPLAGANDESRGLLIGVQGAFSVGMAYIRSNGVDQAGMTSMKFRLDVGYGYVLGDIFELIGMVGFGMEGVLLEAPDGFPSTLYSFLRPAVAGRIRAAEDLVIVELGVGGRIGLDGGDLAAAFGPSMFFGGVDLHAGLMGIIDPGFSYAARFGYTFHSLSFDGVGGSYGDGQGGTDQAVEIQLLIGYALR